MWWPDRNSEYLMTGTLVNRNMLSVVVDRLWQCSSTLLQWRCLERRAIKNVEHLMSQLKMNSRRRVNACLYDLPIL